VPDVQAGYDGIISCATNNFTTSSNLTLSSGTYIVGANTTRVDGTLTVSGGIGTFTSGTIDANAVSVTGGTLTAPSGNFNIAGNIDFTGGNFVHSNGTIVIDGTVSLTSVSAQSVYEEYSMDTTIEELDSYTLEEMLNYAILDEYMAKAEYEAIIETFGEIKPFTNIVLAEQTHIDLLVPLFEAYGIVLPENNAVESVVIPDSITSALATGVEAEEEIPTEFNVKDFDGTEVLYTFDALDSDTDYTVVIPE